MGAITTNYLKKGPGPYLLLIVVALLTWFPVSTHILSLKNDALNLDLPVKYFISQCIHHGFAPVWMDTWALGFPLQSTLNWSIFNPVQLLFYSVFNYNVYTLQWEFLFYIAAAGCGMYWLLKKQLKATAYTALLLSMAYMLSGFAVSSAQFLLFISSFAFIPFCYASFFKYMNKPVLKNGLLFALFYYLLLTGSYPPYVILVSYSLLAAIIIKVFLQYKSLSSAAFTLYRKQLVKSMIPVGFILLLLSAPFIYFTLDVMKEMERGTGISNTSFQHSNFLHPEALLSFLLPFSSVNFEFENTSRLMQDSYFGLAAFLFCFPAAYRAFKKKDKVSLVFLFAAIACLLFSLDGHLPFRSWLNLLWGMNYFRGASIFRLLSIFFLLCFLAPYFSLILQEWLLLAKQKKRLLLLVSVGLTAIALIVSVIVFMQTSPKSSSVGAFVISVFNDGNPTQLFLVGLSIQLALLAAFSLVFWKNSKSWFAFLFVADLAINTIICMPFFALSSYSPSQITKILSLTDGFSTNNTVLTGYAGIKDDKGNPFYNTHVFLKKPSLDNFYVYPILLKQSDTVIKNLRSVLKEGDSTLSFIAFTGPVLPGDTLRLLRSAPGDISFSYRLKEPATMRIAQNYFPGWKAVAGGKEMQLERSPQYGITLNLPSGEGIVNVSYTKKGLVIAALAGAIIFYIGLLLFIISGIKQRPAPNL